MRQVYIAKGLSAPAYKYSHVVKAGPQYFFSGLLPQDPQSGKLVGATPGEQAEQILVNVQVLMQEFGLDFEHLVMARIFTTQMDKFAEINLAWEKLFNSITAAPPARTSLGVAALPMQALVEIEFTFYKPD